MYRYARETSWSNRASVAVAAVGLSCALGWPISAHAHQASLTHSSARVSDDRRVVDYLLKFEPVDVAEVLGLGVNVEPSGAQVRAGADQLLDYVLARVSVTSDDIPCVMERSGDNLGVHLVEQGGRFVEVGIRVTCDPPIQILVIEYQLFFNLDALHRNILHVRYGDERAVAELDAAENRFVWRLDEAPPSALWGFVKSGVEHIAFGFDHIAFLIGLLLVVTIVLSPPETGSKAGSEIWQSRGLRSGLRYTATIVTSFTIAHSLTLIAASLGWIALSTRVVESLIAASIAYVAVENIMRPQTQYRYVVTFGFGLIHGMGFASVLQVMLPPEDVIWPLLMFNVGVELGQLALVIMVLPLLHLFTRAITAQRYHDWFLPIISGVLALLGLAWFTERAFDTVILGL